MKKNYNFKNSALKALMLLLLVVGGFRASAQVYTVGSGGYNLSDYDVTGPYSKWYTDGKQQYLYTATELAAAGLTAGGVNEISFNNTSLNCYGYNCYYGSPLYGLLQNYRISLKNTSSSDLSGGFETGLTQVYGPVSPQNISTGWNTHATPGFSWDGFSNIVVEVCWTGLYDGDYSYSPGTSMHYTSNAYTRVQWTDVNSNVCSDAIGYGEYIDYIRPDIQFIRLTNCSGTPNAGTATGPASVCPGVPFTVSTSGLTIGNGLSFQWFDGASAIGGQTGTSLNTSQASGTHTYKLVTTCSFSGQTNATNVVSVSTNGYYSCYCTPDVSTNGCYGYLYISNVTINTLNNNSGCSGYTDYSGSVSTNLGQGTSYNLSMTNGGSGFFGGAAAYSWIDYNQSGTFGDNANEYYYMTGSGGTYGDLNWNSVMNVPGVAALGNTKMRVILNSYWYEGNDPCETQYYYGEVEDYNINIVYIPPCAGTPNAGGNTVMTTGTMPVCPTASFDLGVNGTLSNGPGITYAWQVNNTNTGSVWVDASLGTSGCTFSTFSALSTTVSGQPVATQYRLKTTCTNSGLTNNSVALNVTQAAGNTCYCIPTSSGNFPYIYITEVDVNGYTRVSGSETGYYYHGTPSVTTLDIGSTYPVQVSGAVYNPEYTGVWVDLDANGDFNGANEFMGGGYIDPYGSGQTYTSNAVIPNGSVAGTTRMRVRNHYAYYLPYPPYGGAFTAGESCTDTYYGETEDYDVTLASLTACAGAPTAGTTASSDPTPCAGLTFTLSCTGATTGLGNINYKWQYKTVAASTWTNLPGGVGQTYAYTFFGAPFTYMFRREMTCLTTNDSAFSAPITLTDAFCYCNATHTVGTGTGYYINEVKVQPSGLDNVSGAGAPYNDYTTSQPTVGEQRNASYWLLVGVGPGTNYSYMAAWVDYDQSGTFSNLEMVTWWGIIGGSYMTQSLCTVPVTAALGDTRMRIRYMEEFTYATPDPCTSTGSDYQYGETEDYTFHVYPSGCATGTQPGVITTITPTQTVVNDLIQPTITGGDSALLLYWEFASVPSFSPVAGSYSSFTGDIIVNWNRTFVYFRAVYQQGACPIAASNHQFVKLDCATAINNVNFYGTEIEKVELGTGGSLLSHTSTGDPSGDGYQNFLSLPATHLTRATSYPIAITTDPYYNEQVEVWLDYNGDGDFQTTERIFFDGIGSGNYLNHTGSFTIPCGNGFTGPVKMRVENVYPTTNMLQDACADPSGTGFGPYDYGEIEEYTIYIDALPDITVNPTAAVCQGQVAILIASGGSGFQWTPTNGVNGVNMTPTNGSAATVTVQTTNPSNVFFSVTGTLANGCTSNNVVPVATTPLPGVVTPIGSIICSGTQKQLTATGAAGAYSWEIATSASGPWTTISGATSGNGYLTAAQTTTKYYRLMSLSSACWNVASNTVVVEIAATPSITYTNVTGNSVTVNWTPVGGGSYTLNWSCGASSGSIPTTTPPQVINNLPSNTTFSATVLLTNPAACSGVSSATATTKTLCAAPGLPSFGTTTATSVVVNVPAGPTSYKIYYKLIQISNTYLSTTCLAGGSGYTITSIYPGAALSIYLQACNCPTAGIDGQAGPAVIKYLLPGTSTCPVPTPFTSSQVTSDCPNRIVVALSGNPTNTYRVTFTRLSPTAAAPNTYNVTGTTMNYTVLNTPLPQVWEVYATSTCGAGYGTPWSIMTNVVQVTVKGGCNKINNLVLSHPKCHGFVAAWNLGDCGIPTTNLLGYTIFYQAGAGPVNATGVPTMPNPVKGFSTFNPNTLYSVYVRSNSCNGSFGPASDVQTIMTQGAGCRDEDQQPEENLLGAGIKTENGTLSLFPNPTPGQFNIDLQTGDLTTQDVRIEVMNMLGQMVVTQITSISGGHLTENVGMPETVTSGTYMVRVMVGEKATFTTRVNISK